MATTRRPRDLDINTSGKAPCPLCRAKSQVLRHRHFLSYSGDLDGHLADNLPPLEDGRPDQIAIDNVKAWVRTQAYAYGGMSAEDGSPLSVVAARILMHAEYGKAYREPPPTETQRNRSFEFFAGLLRLSKSEHSRIWY